MCFCGDVPSPNCHVIVSLLYTCIDSGIMVAMETRGCSVLVESQLWAQIWIVVLGVVPGFLCVLGQHPIT